MDELLEYFQSLLEYAQTNGRNLNRASQQALAQFIGQFQGFIEEYAQTQQPQQSPEQPSREPPISGGQINRTPSDDAQLLWHLAGQQEQAFISYLRTYPTPATQALLGNPTLLSQTIDQLTRMYPPTQQQPEVNGIPEADLASSNVWGAAYDDKTGKMKVRFQGGSEYEYDGVPANIFRAFIHGNANARTRGENEYGRWWPNKNPSLGAALNQYIKGGNFPYRRLN